VRRNSSRDSQTSSVTRTTHIPVLLALLGKRSLPRGKYATGRRESRTDRIERFPGNMRHTEPLYSPGGCREGGRFQRPLGYSNSGCHRWSRGNCKSRTWAIDDTWSCQVDHPRHVRLLQSNAGLPTPPLLAKHSLSPLLSTIHGYWSNVHLKKRFSMDIDVDLPSR